MFSFYWVWAFILLPLPLLIRLLPPIKVQRITSLYVPFLEDSIETLDDNKSKKAIYLIPILMWLLFVSAIARPQITGEPIAIPTEGRDIQLAIDVSGSMRSLDMIIENTRVDRLTAVKYVISKFIQRREGDKLGLILFGDNAYVQSPLSFDRKTINTLLQESFLGIAGKSTAIGDAIGLSVKKVIEDKEKNKKSKRILILVTDGVNTASVDPLEAAKIAKEEGLKIYTIGIGSDGSSFQQFGRALNNNAEIDEETLKKVANITGGKYFRAKSAESLEGIYQELDKLEPVTYKEKFLRLVNELFYIPLFIFILLLIIYQYISRRSL